MGAPTQNDAPVKPTPHLDCNPDNAPNNGLGCLCHQATPINVSSSYICTTSSHIIPRMSQLGSNKVNLDPLRFTIVIL